MPDPLPIQFYNRPTLTVARELLGARLVRILDGVRVEGTIIEAEAYIGEEDLACHARVGRTGRTEPMYGPPGRAYVYFTYGMHWMLNAVTEQEGFPAAVLIRAINVETGLDVVRSRRGTAPAKNWTNGPAKLTAALGINKLQNTIDLTTPCAGLWIEPGTPVPAARVIQTPRMGIDGVPEPWKSIPWRFAVLRNL